MDHSKDWLPPIHEPLPMPPVLESPPSVPSSVLEAQVVTTDDCGVIDLAGICIVPQDGATFSVLVEDGIGLSDAMA